MCVCVCVCVCVSYNSLKSFKKPFSPDKAVSIFILSTLEQLKF